MRTIASPSLAVALVATLVAGWPAGAEDLQVPVASARLALVDTFLIDSVWDDPYLETICETTDALGGFEQDLFSDQVGTYQNCDARSIHESDVFATGVYLESEVRANGINYDFVNIPVRALSESTLVYDFDIPGPRRVRLEAFIDAERTAVTGAAEGSVVLSGPGGEEFALSAIDNASEEEQISGWLDDAGRHTLSVSLRAEVDAATDAGLLDDPETGFVWAQMFLELYQPADVNLDGVIDVNDLIDIIVQWGPCPPPAFPCDADVDRDGTVGVDDLVAAIIAWS